MPLLLERIECEHGFELDTKYEPCVILFFKELNYLLLLIRMSILSTKLLFRAFQVSTSECYPLFSLSQSNY
jgi:hypothetical protein